jgi:hypothetical protein
MDFSSAFLAFPATEQKKDLQSALLTPGGRFYKVHKSAIFLKKAFTLYPGWIRSHDPLLQSPSWQAETIPLDHAAMARRGKECQIF